jgi:hypothetical protein
MTAAEFLIECWDIAEGRKKPTARRVTELAQYFREQPSNSVGGSLHIVLDDENIETRHVQFCIDQATAAGDLLGVALGSALIKCSYTQRRKVSRGYYRR